GETTNPLTRGLSEHAQASTLDADRAMADGAAAGGRGTGAGRRRGAAAQPDHGVPVVVTVSGGRRGGAARSLEPAAPLAAGPGALAHLDVKKLGRIGRIGHRIHGDRRTRVRGIGWEYVHVAIDDRTRLAYAEIYPDETAASATAFLDRAVRWFARWSVQVRAGMTDNGSGFRGYRFAAGRRRLRLH